ncbi:MAG: acyltransferase [Treponemataceae bacterium]|nr:acyltransferase [Treponemataceae bacterium]
MDIATHSVYLIYPLVLMLFCWGMKPAAKGQFYADHFSLDQTKSLQGLAALLILLHHASQKTCASWIPPLVVRHGLDAFLEVGYILVGFFFFCSGYGLYKSVTSKDSYLAVKNFFGKRIWPVVAAFYVTMLIYLAARISRGQHIKSYQLTGYLTGGMLCNTNAWYCITIVIFYLLFWCAFSLVRNKKSVLPVLLVWLGTVVYLIVGTRIDHNDWWFCGEWWYNSVLLFPMGMTWARHEKQITARLQKGYWIRLVCYAAALFFVMQLSFLVLGRFGYYGDTWNQPLLPKMCSRLISALTQNALAFVFCLLLYLFTMKVRVGNLFTRWMGSVTLEFYLIHGLFIELFGFNFLDVARPLKYIRNVGLYVVVVFACAAVSTLVLQAVLHPVKTFKKK